MDQQFNLNRDSFEQIIATASLLQQLQRRAIYLGSRKDCDTPQLVDLVNTQQEIQTGTLPLEVALLRIPALALRLVGAEGAGVWLFAGDAFVYRAGAGTASNDERLRNAVFARLGQGVQSNDLPIEDDSPVPSDELPQPAAKSLLVAPIHQGLATAGALAVFSKNGDGFTEGNVTNIRLLTGLLAQALEKAANARFKRAVTLERAAVLHVIEAVVPTLAEAAETKQRTQARPAPWSNSAENDAIDAAVRSMESSGLFFTESVEEPFPVSTPETVAPAPLSTAFEEAFLKLDSTFVGGTEMEISPITHTPIVSTEVMPSSAAPTGTAVSVPIGKRKLSVSDGSVSDVADGESWSDFRKGIGLRARFVSWRRESRVFCDWFASLAAPLRRVEGYLRNNRYLGTLTRTAVAKRSSVAFALITAVAFLVMRADSPIPLLKVKEAALLSLPNSSVKLSESPVVDGSHKRATDAATAAALRELSRFEIPGLLRQARYGDDSAAFVIGMAYETGQGVPQNCEKAAHWVREAANGGNAAAEYNLGLRYRDGDGILANGEESAKWLQKAAGQKYEQALAKSYVH